MRALTSATPEEIFLENLATIERICAFVCKSNHVTPDEAAEFSQETQVRLVEDDYGIIRKFEGRSELSTYLHTVIKHLFHQFRVEQWGKWRPSAEARRLGDKAIALERLITRDGYTFEEAVQILTTPTGSPFTVVELEAIYLRLPARNRRPMLVSDGETAEAVAAEADASERIMARERERTARRTCEAVDRIIDTFEPDDRLILQMRFWEALKAPEIARRLQLEQKKIYKRLDKLFARMRAALADAGVDRGDIDMLVSGGDQEIRFRCFGAEGNPRVRPSHEMDGEASGGSEDRR